MLRKHKDMNKLKPLNVELEHFFRISLSSSLKDKLEYSLETQPWMFAGGHLESDLTEIFDASLSGYVLMNIREKMKQ